MRTILFAPRLRPAFGRLEAAALALYALVLVVTIPFHEPWADEAQAWLIAKNSTLLDIFYRRLHYEGTPGLWHLLLWLAVHLHLPYAAINWISGLFAVAGAYVVLRYSPFPLVARLVLPFTFWLQYQYAVVARSYCLVPLLTFCVCVAFSAKKKRPVLFAVLAGLLANVSLYSFLWSGVLTLLYCWHLWRHRREGVAAGTLSKAAILLCALFLFAFYTAMPASDLVQRNDGATAFSRLSRLRDRIVPTTPAPAAWQSDALEPKVKFRIPKEGPDQTRYTRGNMLQRALARTLYPTSDRYRIQTWGHRLQRVIIPVNAMFFCVSMSNIVGGLFLTSLLIWLVASHSFRFAWPLVPLGALGAMTWMNDHHAGLLFVAMIAAIWLSLKMDRPPRRYESRIWKTFAVLFVVVLAEQVWWSAHAVVSDIRKPYDPAAQTVEYLKTNAAGKRVVALMYETVAMRPYLAPDPFVNQPTPYWMYNVNFNYAKRMPAEIAKHPDVVVAGAQFVREQTPANQLFPDIPSGRVYWSIDPRYMASVDYKEVARFCGYIFMRGGTATMYCNIVYVPQS